METFPNKSNMCSSTGWLGHFNAVIATDLCHTQSGDLEEGTMFTRVLLTGHTSDAKKFIKGNIIIFT